MKESKQYLYWEKITEKTTDRIKVPFGWLVRSYRTQGHAWMGGASDAMGVGMCFVFDPFHLWRIK